MSHVIVLYPWTGERRAFTADEYRSLPMAALLSTRVQFTDRRGVIALLASRRA